MSFLSALGKIGKAAIGFVPGGNIVNGVLDGISAVAPAISGAAKGSADQRSGENRDALGYGQLANNQARDSFTAGLDTAKFQQDSQDRERKTALLAALLGGVQDAHNMPGNPAIAAKMGLSTGGLRPSALAGTKDSLLQLLTRQTDQAPTLAPYQPAPLPQMQQAGGFEKTLGGIGLGGSILGALGKRNQSILPPVASGGRP